MILSKHQLSRLIEIRDAEKTRGIEALRLYTPSVFQEPFHRSVCPERLVRGGKRAGKTIAAAMEFASLVTGMPLYARDGQPIPRIKSPPQKDFPQIFWIIGWDMKHIGQSIYKYLFLPGMGGTFRTIQDKATGKWRVWNRADPEDVKRMAESELAEPLIPKRMIAKEVWSSTGGGKKADNFEAITLKNGAKIFAYPSSAINPKMGDAVSGIWIDEDIQFPLHLKEWQDRLTDMEGWFLWSVWPQQNNFALTNLIDRAVSVQDDPDRNIELFQLVMSKNSFLPEKGIKQSLDRMETDEERKRRDEGDLLTDQLVMYDYVPHINLIRNKSDRLYTPPTSKAAAWLSNWLSNHNQLPQQWTRYLSIDPSHTRTAVLSAAVPPQTWDDVDFGDMLIVEWEFVGRKYTAQMLAEALRPMMGGLQYEAFIMDMMMGRQTRVGTDQTAFDIYQQAFARQRLVSRQTGSGFLGGSKDPPFRQRVVRRMMAPLSAGHSTLLLWSDKTFYLRKEFASYRKKRGISGGEEVILDEPANPRIHDCMMALEYLCAELDTRFELGEAFVSPDEQPRRGSTAFQQAMRILAKNRRGEQSHVHLGPGSGTA